MPEDNDASSTNDAASSNFYSSPEHDGDTHHPTIGDSDTDSAEELDMPTEDDEETSGIVIGSPSNHGPASKSSRSYTSSTLRGGGSVSPSGHRPFAADKANGMASRSPERKRKRELDTGSGYPHPFFEVDAVEQHSCGVNQLPIVQQGSTYPGSHEAILPLEADSTRKRVKVSKQRDTELEQEQSAAMRDLATIPSPERSRLPIEIWQYIFTFVPPVSLGRLLRVNHTFRACLTGKFDGHMVSKSQQQGVLKLEEADTIWFASRKLFCPGLPRPLRGFKELDMWRLIRGRDCQFCRKVDKAKARSDLIDPWEAGPGQDGVRVVWAFGVRCCGPCLQEKSEKEMDLLFSSTLPSFLLPGLPFIFLTPSLHVVASVALRNSSLPPGVEMKKHFYKTQIETLRQQFEDVKSMGAATAEEWVKGLDKDGKDKLGDAARWEQWEVKGGLRKVNSRPAPKATVPQVLQAASTPIFPPQVNVAGAEVRSERSTPMSANPPTDGPGHAFSPAPTAFTTATPVPSRAYSVAPPPRFSVSPLHNGLNYHQQNSLHQPRIERNIRDVNEAKANRRAEIERRCMGFDPPLLPNVLNHMDSFQAAIQISTSLTDSAWEVLKPRLLAQRSIAERREHDRVLRNQDLQIKTEERRQQDLHSKETKEALDREWDDVQAPIRDRLAMYADEIIHEKWSGGQAVTKDTSPRFAADILIQVRERFYADIAQEDAAARSAGRVVEYDDPERPPTRKLILENMKWLFDTKIKPLTEHFQKELFLCNGCDSNFKFYGFEGVIQHFAAKHTSRLSMGSVVVHWRAEWPEDPPFHPNPSAAKTAFYAIPTPSSVPVPGQTPLPPPALPPPNGYGGYVQPVEHGQQMAQPPIYPQYSPGPYHPAYPGQFPANRIGPFAPPPAQGFQGYGPSFQGAPPSYHQGLPSRPGFPDAHVGYSGPTNGYEGYPGPYQGPMAQMYSSPYPGPAYLPGNQMSDPLQPQGYGSGHAPYGQPATPAFGHSPHPAHQQPNVGWTPDSSTNIPAGQPIDLYQVQMDEMAKNAREIWNGTSSIKDLPGSVRIYVIVFHVVLRFKAKFTNEPSLAMFSDGLAKNAIMRPIKNLNGLACKTCVTSGNGPGAGFHSHPHPPIGDRKLYALPSLLSHFQSVHIERAKSALTLQLGTEIPRLDWKVDMVELPEPSLIAGLLHAPGMDDAKLHLLASTFPAVFPSPLPKLGPGGNTGPVPIFKEAPKASEEARGLTRDPLLDFQSSSPYRPSSKATSSLQPPSVNLSGHVSGHSRVSYLRSIDRSPSRNPRASEPPGEDEYDPHRPAYLEPLLDHGPRSQPRRKDIVQVVTKEDRERYRNSAEPSRYREDGTRSRQGHDSRTVRPTLVRYLGSEDRYSNRSYHDVETPRPPPSRQGPNNRRSDTKSRNPSAYPSGDALPTRSTGYGEQAPQPAVAEQGSEDGEIGEGPAPTQPRTRSASPAEEISAAERFLNEFLPGQDVDMNKPKAAVVDPRNAEQLESKWVAEHKPEEMRRKVMEEDLETASWKSDAAPGGTGEHSLRDTPIRHGPPPPRSRHGRSPQSRQMNQLQYLDYDHLPGPRGRLIERSPELVDPRYVRNTVVFHDPPHVVENQGRRPRSRYTRYEAQRHEQYQTRSRSPQIREKAPSDIAYYRARSPTGPPRQESMYPAYSTPSPQDQAPVKEQLMYTRIPAHSQVRYLEDERAYRTPYGEALEYVPVRVAGRGPQHSEPYVLQRPLDEGAHPGYVRYEGGYQDEPIYEHKGHLYRAEPRSYSSQDPRASQTRHIR